MRVIQSNFSMLRKNVKSILDRSGLDRRRRMFLKRRLFEVLGLKRYSTPSQDCIDQKLSKYLNFKNGFFLEAGANDGYSQSNTYFLEKFKSWRGILVEPIPELFKLCCKERSRSYTFNCALVADSYKTADIKMFFSGLNSIVENSFEKPSKIHNHVEEGARVQNLKPYEIYVPTRTLSSIIDEVGVSRIDFMSLDVEGYEIEALKGLQFGKLCPKYLLIESRDEQKAKTFLAPYFDLVEVMSSYPHRQDLLFKAKIIK